MDGSPEWQGEKFRVSEKGLDRWIQAALAYKSQISTFWENEAALEDEIRQFSFLIGGFTLWEALEEEN